MPLPPKGDPRRPLHLAIRSMRGLGVLLLLYSTCVSFALLRFLRGGTLGASWLVIAGFAVYLVPGVCFLVFSIYVGRRQLWAVIASLCLASLMCLFSVLALGMLALSIASGAERSPLLFIPVAIMLLVVAALVQLIFHLARSFEAIKYLPPDAHGFEPLMATPVIPPAPPLPPTNHVPPC